MPLLQIDIEARFAKFQDTLDQVYRSTAKSAAGITQNFATVRHALEAIGVGLTVHGIVEFFAKAREAAVEFETSTKRLDAVFKNIGDAAGVTKDQIEGFAEELSKSTQFRSDDLRNAESEILRFGKVHGDTFREAIQVSADLAAFMGTSVAAAAHEVGKALADPEHATKLLKEAGVVLSAEQKEQLQHMIAIGDTAGAQVVILKKLQAAYDGLAETMNTGLIKATTGVAKSWHEMIEEIGRSREAGDRGFLGLLTAGMTGVAENLKFLREEFDYIDKSEADAAKRNGASGTIRRPGDTTDSRIAQLKALTANASGKATDFDPAVADAAFAKERIDQVARQKLVQVNLQIIKDNAADTIKVLDSFHADAAISDSAFFAGRIASIKKSMDAEIKALDEGFAAQQLIISKTGKTPDEIANAQVEAVRIDRQRDKVRTDAGLAQLQLTIDNGRAQRDFARELSSTSEATLTLQHNLAAAAAIRAFDPNNDQRRKLNAEAKSPDADRAAAAKAAIEQLDLQGRLIVSKAALSDEELRFSQVLDQVGIAQQRIAIDAAAGAITEIDSLNKLSQVNKERIADLTAIAERYGAIARVSGDPADEIRAQKLRLEIHKLASETDLLAKKFNDAFAGDLANTLTGLADGTVSLKDAFHSLATSILHDINSILAKNFAESLFGKGGGLSGAGGFFQGLLGGGSATAATVPNWGMDWAGAFATGTDFVPRTGLALVHKGEAIVTAADNARGGDRGIHLTQNINVMPGATRQSAQQAAAAAGLSVQRALSRNI